MLISESYIFQVYTDEKSKSKSFQVTYENIFLAPDSNTLKDLNSIDLGISLGTASSSYKSRFLQLMTAKHRFHHHHETSLMKNTTKTSRYVNQYTISTPIHARKSFKKRKSLNHTSPSFYVSRKHIQTPLGWKSATTLSQKTLVPQTWNGPMFVKSCKAQSTWSFEKFAMS